jgi:K+ transporter
MIGCLLLVASLSERAGGAYGVAVTGTMAVTSVLFCVLARQRWRWSFWRVGAVAIVFLGTTRHLISNIPGHAGGCAPGDRRDSS